MSAAWLRHLSCVVCVLLTPGLCFGQAAIERPQPEHSQTHFRPRSPIATIPRVSPQVPSTTHAAVNPPLVNGAPSPSVKEPSPARTTPVNEGVAPSASNDARPKPNDTTPPGDGESDTAALQVAYDLATVEIPELVEARQKLALAQVNREVQKLDEMERELWYYNWMGRLMFVVVHVIIMMGLWMAWLEFKHALVLRRQADQQPSELKLSLDGVALKTSLHGTALLALAFGFYLLYLKFVYPLIVV